jgi:hypothetical protein
MLCGHYHYGDNHTTTHLRGLHLWRRVLQELRQHCLRNWPLQHGNMLHSHYHYSDDHASTEHLRNLRLPCQLLREGWGHLV